MTQHQGTHQTQARNRGVGTVMGQAFLRLARDLGYQASYFNLVRACLTCGRLGREAKLI